MMHGPEKSDPVIVAGKPTNKAERSAAELAEPRTGTKGNADRQSTHWTQSQARVSQALERIRQAVAVTHPRWEPHAGKPHVRICAGGARQLASLPLNRRAFIAGLGSAAAWPVVARAQQPKMLRVGYSGIMPRDAPHYAAFEKRMAEIGYQQGRNFTFEYIQAPSIEGYQQTYSELATRKVDIMLAAGNEPALRAARAAAGATPIVFIALDFDPVEKGYVAELVPSGQQYYWNFREPT